MPEIFNELDGSPLEAIDTSFARYVAGRRASEQAHMENGVPDYAFPLDHELKQKLAAIPGFEAICRNITTTAVAQEIQALNRVALAVGPNQFPEVYRMGVDCAQRLGIGIPNIFVLNNTTVNAYTIAADDTSPVVVIYSGALERFTPGELKCLIAHECGHIHNQHGVFRSVIIALSNGFSATLGSALLSVTTRTMMNTWSRACEVSADRAALICCDDIEDAINVNKKLLYGATINGSYDVNIDALREQLDELLGNPTRLLELTSDHPATVRRIFLDKEFEECELLYRWRPELRRPDTVTRTKAQTDERCSRIMSVMAKGPEGR